MIKFAKTTIVWILTLALGLVSFTEVAAQEGVSRDLLDVYSGTRTAEKPSDFSKIIEACRMAADDGRRSDVDREYASKLLSWAANRRGEILSDEAAAMIEQGNVEKANTLDEKAASDFLLSLQYDRTRWRARHNIAISLALQERFDEAIEQFSYVIDQEPSYVNARFNRGELYFQTGRYNDAVADYSAAIELEPSNPENWSARAHAAFLSEDYEKALADYQKAAQLAGNSPDYFCDFADACQSAFRWTEAGSAYRAALEIDPRHARSLQNAAWLLATCPDPRVRNPKSAREAVDRLLESGVERNVQLWDTMAAADAAMGDFPNAIDSIERAIQLADDDELADLEFRAELYRTNRAYIQPQAPRSESPQLSDGSPRVGTGTR